MVDKEIPIVPKLRPMLEKPLGTYSFRVMRGGRGSGKSFTAALVAAFIGAAMPIRVLCAREYQNSIKESFHAELKNAIQSDHWLEAQYDIGVDYLRHKWNGTEFIFRGLRHNVSSVKSLAQIDLTIVEEAEDIPHASWNDLLPTIMRRENSEVWIIYNPKRRDSWVAQKFDSDSLPPRARVVDVNYCDNPWFPRGLDEQRQHDRETMDPALYAHVWEGAYWERSEAQVFANRFRVSEFEPASDWGGPYFGLDFGFATDPTAATKSWVHGRTLYIEKELYRHHLELDDTASEILKVMPEAAKYAMLADNSRPESISHIKRRGLPRLQACKKGKGSVEHGIEYMLSFDEIVVHPSCVGTIDEMNKYSYKVDRHSGKVLPDLVDADNHAIDSIRYALEQVNGSLKIRVGR